MTQDAVKIAETFDDLPGFSLVDYEEVGLPVYRLTAQVLTLAPKQYPPIDEFILKCIDAGLEDVDSISGLLGIDLQVIEGSLTDLIRDDDIILSGDRELKLTAKSKRVLAGEAAIKPRQQSLTFNFDGLVRCPKFFGGPLWAPRELKESGIREIRAFPASKPEPHEVNVEQLTSVLQLQARHRKSDFKLLRVREIGKKESKFLPAVMLIYKSNSGTDIRVRFTLEGRLSEEHERSFLTAGGIEKLNIREAILRSGSMPSLKELIGAELESALNRKLAPVEPSLKKKRLDLIAKLKKEIGTQTDNAIPEDGKAAREAEVDVPSEEPEDRVRPIAVYEHPSLLKEAITTAQKRVLIISPWITPAVVDPGFLKSLREALERGVEIFIDYGLDDKWRPKNRPNQAEKALHELSDSSPGLKIVRSGNTHAKVLLKDSDWFVVTSFNWLSFKGDPKRTFREEWGTLVSVGSIVDKYFSDFAPRFDQSNSGR